MGHYIKHGIRTRENESNTHAHSAILVSQLARDYISSHPSVYESMIDAFRENQLPTANYPRLRKALFKKTPYQCTKRYIGYVADTMDEFEKFQKHVPDVKMIYSNRDHMKRFEDTSPIENLTDYYSFSHKSKDDDLNSSDFEEKNSSNGYVCRYCTKTFDKKGKAFDHHERFCQLAIDTCQGHKIRYQRLQCHCHHCHEGNAHQCQFKIPAGAEESRWLVSITAENAIRSQIAEEDSNDHIKTLVQSAKSACEKMKQKFGDGMYPSFTETCKIKSDEWSSIVKLCKINVKRLDGDENKSPRIIDIQRALRDALPQGWKEVFTIVEKENNCM